MLDLPTPELPTRSAWRSAQGTRAAHRCPRPFGLHTSAGTPTGRRWTQCVRLPPRPPSRPWSAPAAPATSCWTAKATRPVDHGRLGAGRPAPPRPPSSRHWRHRFGPPARGAPDKREAARVDAVDHDPVVVDPLGHRRGRPGAMAACRSPVLAHRGQDRFALVLAHHPGGVAPDRDRAARRTLPRSRERRGERDVSRTVRRRPAARANLLDALGGPAPGRRARGRGRRPLTVRFDDEVTAADLVDDLITIESVFVPGPPRAEPRDEAAATASVGLADPELDGSRIIETYLGGGREPAGALFSWGSPTRSTFWRRRCSSTICCSDSRHAGGADRARSVCWW